MRKLLFFALFLFVASIPNAPSKAQTASGDSARFTKYFAGVPSGSCGTKDQAFDTTNSKAYVCSAGSWALQAIACSQFPALTGDTTTSAGACATTTAKINGTSFSGTNGHLVSFGASNVPADSGIVASGVTQTIASGAKALATGAISSATCTSAQTATATGTLTTDRIVVNFNGDPTAVTGYVPSTSGMLTIIVYPTADTFNAKVCNNTSASITPGAITLNWRVVR